MYKEREKMKKALAIASAMFVFSNNVQGMNTINSGGYSLPTPERSPTFSECQTQVSRNKKIKLMPSTPPQQEATPPRSNKLSKNAVSTDLRNNRKLIQTYIKTNQKLLYVIFNLRRVVYNQDRKWVDENEKLLKNISDLIKRFNIVDSPDTHSPRHVVVPLQGEEELPFYAAENKRLWRRVRELVEQLQNFKQTKTNVAPNCSNLQGAPASAPQKLGLDEVFDEFISWEPNTESN